jgi:hypothetical protein
MLPSGMLLLAVIIRPQQAQLVKSKLFFQKSQPQSGIVFFEPLNVHDCISTSTFNIVRLWNTQKTAQIYNGISVPFHTMTRPDAERVGVRQG